jgi:hypothetical protein
MPPTYLDLEQKVARQFGLTTLSEVALVDIKSEKVLYRGAIDDRVTLYYTKQKAEKEFLKKATLEALANQPVEQAHSDAFGCLIQFQ